LAQDQHNFNKGNEQGQQLMERSFKELGAGRSILLDKNGNIIAGNKSQQAAIAAGIKKVRVIETTGDELVAVKRTDVDIDSAEGRKMAYLDNLTTQVNLTWDQTELEAVQADVEGFEVADFGFDIEDLPQVVMPTGDETEEEAIERKRKEFEEKMAAGELDEDDPEYQEFVKKFEAKRTTDDCYTPEVIYDAVAEYVASEYGVSRANFVRPFYPGGDYQREKYKPTDIVVDNPPFSILASIIDWYNERGIRYFLFGPQLTLVGSCINRCTCLAVGVPITYANGANVSTSFCTNLEDKDIVIKADTRLYKMVFDANALVDQRKKFPRYAYPKHVIMAPFLHQCAKHGVDFIIRKGECYPIEELDAQAEAGKAIYGKGYLVSDRVVERRLEAELIKAQHDKEEQENAQQWELSERERAIIEGLNQNAKQ
jgi:hypothetical protein